MNSEENKNNKNNSIEEVKQNINNIDNKIVYHNYDVDHNYDKENVNIDNQNEVIKKLKIVQDKLFLFFFIPFLIFILVLCLYLGVPETIGMLISIIFHYFALLSGSFISLILIPLDIVLINNFFKLINSHEIEILKNTIKNIFKFSIIQTFLIFTVIITTYFNGLVFIFVIEKRYDAIWEAIIDVLFINFNSIIIILISIISALIIHNKLKNIVEKS